jgi:hypothetical protein
MIFVVKNGAGKPDCRSCRIYGGGTAGGISAGMVYL